MPQVCIDAQDLQDSGSRDYPRIIQLYSQCINGDLCPSARVLRVQAEGIGSLNRLIVIQKNHWISIMAAKPFSFC